MSYRNVTLEQLSKTFGVAFEEEGVAFNVDPKRGWQSVEISDMRATSRLY